MSDFKKNLPPKLLLKLLKLFLKPEYLEEIEGDLEEVYNEDIASDSERKAKLWYAWEVLKLVRPLLMKNLFKNSSLNQTVMFRNYLRIGWRNILKHKAYAAINVFGLSIGIATTLTLLMIISYEKSFDKDLPEVEQIYRVADQVDGKGLYDVIVVPQLPLLVEEIPEIISGTRFFNFTTDYVRANDDFISSTFHVVDSGFAKTFDLEVLYGDLEQSLSTPGNIVITKSVATKFFQQENPVGEVLTFVNQDYELKIGAVLADRPKNSSIQFEMLVLWDHAPKWVIQIGDWYNTFMPSFVKLSNGTQPADIQSKLRDFQQKHYRKERKDAWNMTLLPLTEEHGRNADNQLLLNVLAIIAGCILVISCINFINLSTTQSVGRAREIGIRKVMGSQRRQLIFQFLTESLIVSTISIALGLLLLTMVVPKVNDFFYLDMSVNEFSKLTIAMVVLFGILITGGISGMYPALFISKLKTVESLKNKVRSSKTGSYFQKALLVLQFGSSILLIAGTLLISRQVDFMKSTNLNFDGNETIGVNGSSGKFKDPEQIQSKMELLTNLLKASPSVKNISIAQTYPGNYRSDYNGYIPSSENGTDPDEIRLRAITIDDHYFETLGIELIMGENFSSEKKSATDGVIINKTAMTQLGWTSVEGKYLTSKGSGEQNRFKVVGVVDDYYYQSLEMPIEPIIHYFFDGPQASLIVKFEKGKVSEGIETLKRAWKELDAYEAVSFDFIDRAFNEQYRSHERLGTTVMVFSIIALTIAGLGLFSIASFTIKLKRKEVGIRKVLGASLKQLLTLLSRNYMGLVGLSLIIAAPFFYFMSERFLTDFANRINFDISILIISGIATSLIALVCISFEAIKTALSNPINHLRDD